MVTLKVFHEKTAKRVEIPKDYSLLCKEISKWIPLPEQMAYTFIDQGTQEEVYNEKTYQILMEKKKNEQVIKFNIVIKNKADIKEEMKDEVKKEEDNVKMIVSQQKPINVTQEESENKLKETIANLVKSKLKELEESIISEICENINETTLSKVLLSQQQAPPKQSVASNVVHKGIQCSNCSILEIKGVRFKCSTCQNYNLCSNCEEYSTHDLNHIMIKMRFPDNNIKESHQIKYVTEGLNYSYSPCYIKTVQPKILQLIEFKQMVKITNTGMVPWPMETAFKCCEKESEIIGKAPVLKAKIQPNGDFNLEITFDIKNKIQGQYFSYWQMFTPKNVPFGEVAKFKIEIA